MQLRRGSSLSGAAGNLPWGERTASRGRSSTLKRAGASVSTEVPTTPQGLASPSSATFLGTSAFSEAQEAGGDVVQPSLQPLPPEEPCGLTPASLKHLRRQKEQLTEDKVRLQAEIAALLALLKQQKEQVVVMEAAAAEAKEREADLQREVAATSARELSEKDRADNLDKVNSKLEESLAKKEAEIARLLKALEEQRHLMREVCEAADRKAESDTRAKDLAQRLKEVEAERTSLQQELLSKSTEWEEMRLNVAGAMLAAEKAMAMHAMHVQRIEQLRAAKISEAINQKIELHVSVPRVTLCYNNAPPLLVSVAAALGDMQIREFIVDQVFPHFEPLWVNVDAIDKAPDGTCKRAYSMRMLERLTEAVKGFVEKSQQADSPQSDDSVKQVVNSTPKGPGQSGQRNGPKDISESDRLQLLQLLRSTDDAGLDEKLKQMLGK